MRLKKYLINAGNLQQAEFNTQDSCKIDLATVFSTSYNWLQSVPVGTGYTALYTCFNNWLQSVPAGTGYTALYTCFYNWLQSVPAGTGYTALYTCFNLPSTYLTNDKLSKCCTSLLM